MSWSIQLIVAAISALFSVILTAIVSYLAWRGRGVLGDIDKNSSFRRLMTGEETYERDSGELQRIDAQFNRLRAEQEREHAEVREDLVELKEEIQYLTEFVRRIGRAINRSDIDETVQDPEGKTSPGFYRTGSSDTNDD
jgi:hypothetical protein